MSSTLPLIGAVALIGWGAAHLAPTWNVVKDFGNISEDNRRIITMEWIIEGFTLIFIGILTMAMIFMKLDPANLKVLFWIIFCMLNTFSIISLFTGARVNFLPFRLCPIIFTTASVLIVLGAY